MTGQLSPLDDRMAALEAAATRATHTSAFCEVPPCALVLHRDRLELRLDRPAPGAGAPARRSVQGAGAVVLAARVALAGQGWTAEVERLPRPDDRELVAVLRPVAGRPEAGLAPLAAVAAAGPLRRRTPGTRLPSPALLQLAGRAAAMEDAVLIPVTSDPGHRLLDDLDREARAVLGHDLPAGPAAHPGQGSSGRGVFLLLATDGDDELAWLRSGEALERVLLVLAARGWPPTVLPHVFDVPLLRARVRSDLCWDDHPQALVRVG
ncbi:hypothetical protein [Blastococcus sp. SYSU D01042]